jgi:hypothetical protein
LGHDRLGFRDTFWDKLGEVVLNVASDSFVEVDVVSFLAVDTVLFDDPYSRKVLAAEPQFSQRTGNLPLMKLRPVHSTCVVTITLLDTLLAHMMHVLVLTENTFPLGTSGVRVVVMVVTKSSKSQWTTSSLSSHLVCRGPMEA